MPDWVLLTSWGRSTLQGRPRFSTLSVALAQCRKEILPDPQVVINTDQGIKHVLPLDFPTCVVGVRVLEGAHEIRLVDKQLFLQSSESRSLGPPDAATRKQVGQTCLFGVFLPRLRFE